MQITPTIKQGFCAIIKVMEHKNNIENIRHSLAHLLGASIMELYPGSKITLGPAIDNGFYYDVDVEGKITDADLNKIEKRMKQIIKNWKTFEKKIFTKDEALKFFEGNEYKTELINEISEKGEEITVYQSGDFADLCRGGHVENIKDIPLDAFKIDRVAGAYWRGDEKNKMLTRIYGLAFETKEKLDAYIIQQEEAKKRDHRKLGKELDLFCFSDLVGPGLPLFTPKGTAMRDAIVDKIESIQKKLGYQKVTIPHITKKDLYETSGHWEKFGDELFKVKGKDSEFVMKPMNCPHHTQIYASKPRSYKELPVKYVETTMVYRDEQKGELLGLSRVRSISQDDGHVFCTPEQVKDEIKNIILVIKEFYSSLDMWNEDTVKVFLSVRDPKTPEKYMGESSDWDNSEKALEDIIKEEKLPYTIDEGEAAFYGPKLDFKFKDAIGREWQLATVQLDFNMPKRFELEYVDSDGVKKTPVMIHRAIAGALERFLSVIIEHFAGNFPVWLSPVQVIILPISEKQSEYANSVYEKLKEQDIRVELDNSNESLGKRIRNAKVQKTPYIIVIGDKEKEDKTITVEAREEKLEGIKIEEFLERIEKES